MQPCDSALWTLTNGYKFYERHLICRNHNFVPLHGEGKQFLELGLSIGNINS